MNIYIGCSGFYYAAWKNNFYPEGLSSRKWLEYYSSVFNTLELNGTFYRVPKLTDLEKYVNVTPPHFRFSVKMSRFVTHVKRLSDVESIQKFQDLITTGLGSKLACFLFQMPPSFHYSEENLQRIVDNIPHHTKNVIEFRHASWWNTQVADTLHDLGITFCNVDFPRLESHVIDTHERFYMRFHGNPELFISSYSEEEIRKYFSQVPADCKEAYFYFNNTMFEAGYTNARELMSMALDS
ncbi:MAG: DUF72 domain-containing protein [Bacteroidota bacterium]